MPQRDIEQPAALVECVRDRLDRGGALVDYGLAHEGLGQPPPEGDGVVRLCYRASPNDGGILEHYVRDMTVRVSAGLSLGELERRLKAENQFLPLDGDDDISVGEAIAHNVYGPLRVRYGSMRDLLLGLSFVDGLGADVKVGGRTVKNVAGYDLTRFMVGSLNQFGLIHEAILRTYARPRLAARATLSLPDPTAIDAAVPAWIMGAAAPTYVAMASGPTLAEPFVVHVGYLGDAVSCAAQTRALGLDCQSRGLAVAEVAERGFDADQADRQAFGAWRRGAAALVKIVTPPARTGRMCQALRDWAARRGEALRLNALPVHGVVFAGGPLDAAAAIALDQTILATLENEPGLRAWMRRPTGAHSIPPFAPEQLDWPVLGQLKGALDPRGVFNPGRFL